MAEGMVLQLQAEALDENIDIETLLRRAYLIARKLGLSEFEAWVVNEQNGYSGELPGYRPIGGEIKAWNPYYGWTPVVMKGKLLDMFSQMPVSQPISTIVDTYNNSDGAVYFALSGEMNDYFNKNSDGFETNYCFMAARNELHKIISAVRNSILEWAILLESNGIKGDGLMFKDNEKKTAKESISINNYTNNFYSTVDGAQIQQGGNSNQQ